MSGIHARSRLRQAVRYSRVVADPDRGSGYGREGVIRVERDTLVDGDGIGPGCVGHLTLDDDLGGNTVQFQDNRFLTGTKKEGGKYDKSVFVHGVKI